MSRRKGSHEPERLTIAYKELGTISIEEFRDALIEDIQALREIYNVRYVDGARLQFHVTNEYGEQIRVRRPAGGTVNFMDSHHYKPACTDYDL